MSAESSSLRPMHGRAWGSAEQSRVLDVRSVAKHFGATVAVDGVDLAVNTGEIVAVVGHNGAGKSTLLRCIGGFHAPTRGTIAVGGVEQHSLTVQAARRLGVRSVRQELSLPTSLSAVECAVLMGGSRARRLGAGRHVERELGALFGEMFGREMPNPRQHLDRWEFAQRQLLEVCLAFLDYREGLRVVLLDEATSALDADVAETLLRWVRGVSESHGVAVLVSSHRLQELVGVVHRAVVMADGMIVGLATGGEVTEARLVELMRAGMVRARAAAGTQPGGADGGGAEEECVGRKRISPGEAGAHTLIEIASIAIPPSVRSATLRVDAGEIVGIGGLEGQGQSELLRWLYAHVGRGKLATARSRPTGDSPGSTRQGLRPGFVTGDTRREGVFPYWSVRWNTSIKARKRLGQLGVVRSREERSVVDALLAELAVRGRPDQNIMELSGGTQQKVVLGRALLDRPKVLLLDDPTRGIDVTTKDEIYRLFTELAQNGVGLLWYSSEISELRHCDRVYVMYGGSTVGELKGAEVDERILEMSFSHA